MKVDFALLGGGSSYGLELTELAERARDARPALRGVLAHFLTAEHEQFATDGARGGTRWPIDKTATLADKRARGQNTRPLRRTGALERSLTQAKGKGTIRRVSRTSLRFGSGLIYASMQRRYGRSPILFTAADTDRAGGALAAWLLEGRT